MKNLEISEANKDEMAVWKNLQKYPAWKRLVSMLQERIKEADLVINQVGGDREAEFSKRDIAIVKKNSYLDLIEFPEKMIETLSGTGVERTEEMDPYKNDTGDTDYEDDDF